MELGTDANVQFGITDEIQYMHTLRLRISSELGTHARFKVQNSVRN